MKKCLKGLYAAQIVEKLTNFIWMEDILASKKRIDQESCTERVRSKSELLISDHLNRYGVPYRYEKPLELIDWTRTVICRPDFTVMNRRTGKIMIYEHLGMMDDEAYVTNNTKKVDLYEKNGFLIGKNLIVTHETSMSPLNMNVVDSYIETFFV